MGKIFLARWKPVKLFHMASNGEETQYAKSRLWHGLVRYHKDCWCVCVDL